MESFFKEYGGAVLSTTFDKYCYVNVRHLPRFFDYSTELSYSKTERVTDIAVLLYQIKEVVLCKRYEYELIVPMGINIFGFAASSTLCYYITRPGLYFVFLILQGIYIAERRREKQNENSMCRNMV